MKNLLLCSLYLICFRTYSVIACDADACQIGTSTAIGTGCAVAGTALSLTICAVTFGIGCAVGTAATAGICGAVTGLAEYGKTFYI